MIQMERYIFFIFWKFYRGSILFLSSVVIYSDKPILLSLPSSNLSKNEL